MKKVTKEELYTFINPQNVTYTAYGEYPYIGLWKTRSGNTIAKSIPIGKHLGISTDKYDYYIL